MAQYNRYVSVPHLTYDVWRSATLGNGYNVDYYYRGGYGNQCWDYCALLYWQYGLTLVTKAGGGTAYDCWNVSRAINSRYPFQAITGVQNIRIGDIIITKSPASSTGHICFADEDYNGTLNLNCLGQNQRGGGNGYPATLDNMSLVGFLGIFRNTNWQGSPSPTPESGYNKDRYNFVLFIISKRQEKWTKKPLRKR